MREAIAKALYEAWCVGAKVGRECFDPYPWEEFKTIPFGVGTPRVSNIYRKADLLVGGFGSVDIVLAGIHVEEEPDGWLPTPENINALPEPVREYVYHLETRADPALEVRELIIAKDTIRALERDRRAMEKLQDLRFEKPTLILRLISEGRSRGWTFNQVGGVYDDPASAILGPEGEGE